MRLDLCICNAALKDAPVLGQLSIHPGTGHMHLCVCPSIPATRLRLGLCCQVRQPYLLMNVIQEVLSKLVSVTHQSPHITCYT